MPFRGLVYGDVAHDVLHRAVRDRLGPLRADLARRGLVPDAERRAWTILVVPLILGPIALLGIAKAFVGTTRDRPVGLLEILIVATIMLGFFILAWLPDRTGMGDTVLDRCRARFRRAAEAPRADEVLFAFALNGAAALIGTHLDAYGRLLRANGAGDSGCGGGGGDSGCGGCGGGD